MKKARRLGKCRSTLLGLTILALVLICGCRPSGRSDFKASQQAFQRIQHVKVEWSAETEKGSFKEIAEVDCSAPYYHRSSLVELTPKGVVDGTRSALGQPLAHQETEALFVDGRSWVRSSGAWGFDAKPEWSRPPGGSYNPTTACKTLQDGKDPEDGPFAQGVHFFPVLDFARILTGNQIVYVTERVLADGPCREYRVTYEDSVESRRIATPNGEEISYEMRPVQATACLGSKDHLPRQVAQGDWTVKYSYDAFEKLASPPVTVMLNAPTAGELTAPDPPNSVEVSTRRLENYPSLLLFMMGGVLSEGEKENLVFNDDDMRLFQTDASAAEVLSLLFGPTQDPRLDHGRPGRDVANGNEHCRLSRKCRKAGLVCHDRRAGRCRIQSPGGSKATCGPRLGKEKVLETARRCARIDSHAVRLTAWVLSSADRGSLRCF